MVKYQGDISFNQASAAEQTLLEFAGIVDGITIDAIWIDGTELSAVSAVSAYIYKKIAGTYRLWVDGSVIINRGADGILVNMGAVSANEALKIVLKGSGAGAGYATVRYEITYRDLDPVYALSSILAPLAHISDDGILNANVYEVDEDPSAAEALRLAIDKVNNRVYAESQVTAPPIDMALDSTVAKETTVNALNNLSQVDIRSAVGLASANLDTQLSEIEDETDGISALATSTNLIKWFKTLMGDIRATHKGRIKDV